MPLALGQKGRHFGWDSFKGAWFHILCTCQETIKLFIWSLFSLFCEYWEHLTWNKVVVTICSQLEMIVSLNTILGDVCIAQIWLAKLRLWEACLCLKRKEDAMAQNLPFIPERLNRELSVMNSLAGRRLVAPLQSNWNDQRSTLISSTEAHTYWIFDFHVFHQPCDLYQSFPTGFHPTSMHNFSI